MSDPSAVQWPDVLGPLLRREDLPTELVAAAMRTILAGDATDAQIAGFAVGLRAKGETTTELATMVRTMLEFATRVEVDRPETLVDTCGTGGDRAGTVNVSTMAAIIAAGAGARVAKHGNRAQSSDCGSADVLEQLGVVIDLDAKGVVRCIEEAGIGFCLAPTFHPAMRFAGPSRRELGVPTTFNFLGPLANPAGVRRQAIGVSDPTMAERVVGALVELGAERALVFHGDDGLDELTTTTTSTMLELREGEVRRVQVDPGALGLARADRSALMGGDAAANADRVRSVLAGEAGPVRDIAALNAAAALVVAGIAEDLGAGLEVAGAAIDDGRASATLDAFVRASGAARDAGFESGDVNS